MGAPTRIRYQPALDGVRAVAVAVVLLFHAGVPGFGGGYLGVSIFFTLSGYLITSLLIEEHRATGTVDLVAFSGRRIRRLLPASLVTIGAVVAIAAATDEFGGVVALRRHVVGSLLQVVNWVFLTGEGSYQERLAGVGGAVSPLEHFWSLAIEEQFYWCWPLVALLLFRRARTRQQRTVAIGVLAAAAIVATAVIALVWGGDAAYWATPARLPEILLGALAAATWTGRDVPSNWRFAASVALALLAAGVVAFPDASDAARLGLLPLVGFASTALLVGLQVDGPVRRVLSTAPLVGLGRISYGVYLYHWPIYVLVDADRLGTDGPALLAVRLALTLAIALASHVLIEQPIRRARPPRFAPAFAGGVATAALATAAMFALPSPIGQYWQLDTDVIDAASIRADAAPLAPLAAEGSDGVEASGPPSSPPSTVTDAPTTDAPTTVAGSSTAETSRPATTGPVPTAAPPSTAVVPTTTTLPPLPVLNRPVRIVVSGDSTGEALGTGIVRWAASNPELAQAEVQAAPGCGFVMGGERRHGDSLRSMSSCDGWVESQLVPTVERTRPDVVVVMVTTWDVIDRRWDDGDMIGPDTPDYRRRLDEAYADLVGQLVDAGAARVAFVREPVPNPWWLGQDGEQEDPARHAVLAEVFAGVASAHPGTVGVIDFADWFVETGYDDDHEVRPDGVHLDPAAAEAIADDWLGEQVIRVALDAVSDPAT